MKTLSITEKLTRNLEMGKKCRVRFQNQNGKLCRAWVIAVAEPVEVCPETISFFDTEKNQIVSCKKDRLFDLETESQYKIRMGRAEIRTERAKLAAEIADFYGVSLSQGFKILFTKKAVAAYEYDRNTVSRHESRAYTMGSPYSTLCYGL